jgi:hypothetical protein
MTKRDEIRQVFARWLLDDKADATRRKGTFRGESGTTFKRLYVSEDGWQIPDSKGNSDDWKHQGHG